MKVVYVALAAVLVVLVGAGPAQAERRVIADGRGDVYSPEGSHGWTSEGSVVNADVTRTVVRLDRRDFSMDLTYVDLAERASDEINVDLVVLTSDKKVFAVNVQEDWEFRTTYVPVSDAMTAQGVECPGATGSASPVSEHLRFSIPASCFGAPRWVRFYGNANAFSEGQPPFGLFRDDFRWDGHPLRRWSARLYAR